MPNIAERTDRAHYLADLGKATTLGGPSWVQQIREAGAANFSELEFPSHRDEAWRGTDIRPIVKTAYRSIAGAPSGSVSEAELDALILTPGTPRIVLVDGRFDAALSKLDTLPDGLRVLSLADAIAKDDAVVKEHLDQYAPVTNAFVALNAAFLQDGVLIEVDANTAVEEPVHAIYISTVANAATYPRNLVIVGESAELNLVETYAGMDGGAYLSNAVSEIVVGANARLRRHKIVQEGAEGNHLETAQVVQARDSRYEAFTITLTGRLNRNELRVMLNGENAQVSLNGLYLNDGNRVIDNALNVEHVASHCRSRMKYKGILDGDSTAVFTGKVYVHQDAQRTDSDQLNQNLLLSDTASVDTRPQLEIFADDVKCTHGATVGGFPDELLFYFRSRGISAEMASGILTSGFGEEIIDAIEAGPLKEKLAAYVFDKYKAAG